MDNKKMFSNTGTLSQEEINELHDQLKNKNKREKLTLSMKIGLAVIILTMIIVLILVINKVI